MNLFIMSECHEDTSSKVGLCCVFSIPEQAQITETTLVQHFSDCGVIKEVYIFQSQPVVKAFLEFANIESLETALQTSSRTQTSFGKVKLFRSHKSNIDVEIKQKALKLKSARAVGYEAVTLPISNCQAARVSFNPDLKNVHCSLSSTNSEKAIIKNLDNPEEITHQRSSVPLSTEFQLFQSQNPFHDSKFI